MSIAIFFTVYGSDIVSRPSTIALNNCLRIPPQSLIVNAILWTLDPFMASSMTTYRKHHEHHRTPIQ